MVSVTSKDNIFIFEIKGWHKIWALESKITIPKEKILEAYQNKEEFTFWKGLRMPGTEIPGFITAGTFYKKGRNFWDVMNKKKAIIVALDNHYYKKLIIEVENPEAVMKELNSK
ncbi:MULTISPECIES: hypothetical protein [Flavobacterium]|jgi:hypothetical protein|uniref:Bacterial Pleckstrin homology domain-containing protein n=1 Tax=Flavobacterium algoritolerans TaxID=3041254 RepID=A0ABT6VBA9_9FLAO|nr:MULTISPECIES: hypothetical protein [Flavobacterium]MDI5887332.1 hypothetical protein [Flavobacterium yafengii]MDI5895523.1 hypothetical protein [Flavobacterium algoritolerans]